MKRFKFSLESVLMLRKKNLVDEQTKLSSILDTLNKQKEELDNIINQLSNLKSESEEYLQGGKFNPITISNYSMYATRLQEKIMIQRTIIKRTNQALENQKQITKQAYIKVKSLENLEDKQKEQYLKEIQLEEIKEIDDIVNSRRSIA